MVKFLQSGSGNKQSRADALSGEEVLNVLKSSDVAWTEWLRVLDSPATVQRLLERAEEANASLRRYREIEATAWRMADAFGCRYVQAIGPYAGSVADAGRSYRGLCDRARDHGLVVGLEFLPFTNIYSAADALAIVETAVRDAQ